MPKIASTQIAVIGIDIGKTSFHVVATMAVDRSSAGRPLRVAASP